MPSLEERYPWTSSPVIVNGPMRPYCTAPIAAAVTQAGGIGMLSWIPAQTDKDLATLQRTLTPFHPPSTTTTTADDPSSSQPLLPIGIGYLLHSTPLDVATAQIAAYRPAIAWLFAPGPGPANTLRAWAAAVRSASPRTALWVQVGSVAEAVEAVTALAEYGGDLTLVAQGADAGGHGLASGAGITALVPEMRDALDRQQQGGEAGTGTGTGTEVLLLAAGGIMDGRGAAAALALGAHGVVLGSRMLGCEEIAAPDGFRESVLAAEDGGQSTVRTLVFDRLRGTKLGGETGWPLTYNGRGLRNNSSRDADDGVGFDEVKRRFVEAQKEGRPERFGAQGRDVTYVGTGVGLVRDIRPAKDIVEEVRRDAIEILQKTSAKFMHKL